MGVSKEKWNKERFTQNLRVESIQFLSWPYCALDTFVLYRNEVKNWRKGVEEPSDCLLGVVAAVREEKDAGRGWC